ncbi:MAG: hypothetical protein L0Y54_11510, partial [Sporichthyaceae bacterium]|nr:hypothetical protein [Sporichthyaceae bacterium]
ADQARPDESAPMDRLLAGDLALVDRILAGDRGPEDQIVADQIQVAQFSVDQLSADPIKADPIKADPIKADPIKSEATTAQAVTAEAPGDLDADTPRLGMPRVGLGRTATQPAGDLADDGEGVRLLPPKPRAAMKASELAAELAELATLAERAAPAWPPNRAGQPVAEERIVTIGPIASVETALAAAVSASERSTPTAPAELTRPGSADPAARQAAGTGPGLENPADGEAVRPPVGGFVPPAILVGMSVARRRRLMVTGLGIAITLISIMVGALGYQAYHAGQISRARLEATAAVQAAAPALLSYDYRHLSADFQNAAGRLAEPLRSQYLETSTKVISPRAIDQQLVVTAELAGSSIVSAAPDQVVALVYINRTTSSALLSSPKIDLSRIRVTAVRDGGNWLISRADVI